MNSGFIQMKRLIPFGGVSCLYCSKGPFIKKNKIIYQIFKNIAIFHFQKLLLKWNSQFINFLKVKITQAPAGNSAEQPESIADCLLSFFSEKSTILVIICRLLNTKMNRAVQMLARKSLLLQPAVKNVSTTTVRNHGV
jgi:hypothetical protein